jgi:hypothetical protein
MGVKHTFKVLDQVQTSNNLTRGRAIRLHCIDCSGGVASEVRKCHIRTCVLWPFRMGRTTTATPATTTPESE